MGHILFYGSNGHHIIVNRNFSLKPRNRSQSKQPLPHEKSIQHYIPLELVLLEDTLPVAITFDGVDILGGFVLARNPY